MQVYMNNPINGCAPAQPAMRRLLRSTLPTSRSVLQPCVVNAKPDLQERQQRTKCFYDRVAASLKPLTSGDVIRVQRKWGWDTAIMQYIHESPHSYVVRHEGGQLRRNRRHLRRTLKQLPLFLPELDDPCTGVAAQPSRRAVAQQPPGVVAQPPPAVIAQPPPGVVAQPPLGVIAQPLPGVVAQPPPGVFAQQRLLLRRTVAEPPRRSVHPSEQTERYSKCGRMIRKRNSFDC